MYRVPNLVDKLGEGARSFVDGAREGARSFVDNTYQYVGAMTEGVSQGARNFVAGIKDNTIKYARAMTEGVSQGAKGLAFYGLVGAVVLGAGVKLAGETPPIRYFNFEEMMDDSVYWKSVAMAKGDNLKILDGVPPASIVEVGSEWHMGFISYSEGIFVGYAKTGYYPKSPCRMGGRYSSIMGEGNRPDDVWTVEDVGKDGIAWYYPDTGTLVFDEGDNFYFSRQLMFGPDRIYGDVSQLPVFPSGSNNTDSLPKMEIDDRPPRSGPADMNDLTILAENWLCSGCHPYDNNDCNGADWDYNGGVNFQDFAYMSKGWDPNYIAPLSMPSSSPLESSALLKSSEIYSTSQDESGVYVVDGVEPNPVYPIKVIKKGDEVIAKFGD
jgi:hypothetical protein